MNFAAFKSFFSPLIPRLSVVLTQVIAANLDTPILVLQ